jgi:CRP/FNR family transcriptional regulator, cyclic AMP receptor protein
MESPAGKMFDPHILANSLGNVPHFKGMSDSDRQTIVNAGQVRRFAAGATIFVEGEASAGMFVLIKGQVHLRKLGPQGQESIIAVIEPVIMFNEVTALDGGPNLTTAIAVQDCITWNVDYDSFGRVHKLA